MLGPERVLSVMGAHVPRRTTARSKTPMEACPINSEEPHTFIGATTRWRRTIAHRARKETQKTKYQHRKLMQHACHRRRLHGHLSLDENNFAGDGLRQRHADLWETP